MNTPAHKTPPLRPWRNAWPRWKAELRWVVFASGTAAISTVMTLLRAGDHVICSDDVYGGTYRIFETVFRTYGLEFSYVNT